MLFKQKIILYIYKYMIYAIQIICDRQYILCVSIFSEQYISNKNYIKGKSENPIKE
jgi:hypothetical protein